MFVTDTHSLIWYFNGKHSSLSPKVLLVFQKAENAEKWFQRKKKMLNKTTSSEKEIRKTLCLFMLISILSISISATPWDGKCERWFAPAAADNPVKYFDSAEEACQDYVKRFRPGETWKKGEYVNDNNQYTCKSNDASLNTNADRAVADDCCNREVLGPYLDIMPDVWRTRVYTSMNPPKYRLMDMFPWQGRMFNGTQREKIIEYNLINGMITSDVNDLKIPGVTDYCTELILSDPNDDCAAQIHHIIPRKDSKGCDCGRNSYKNAIVISRKLNGEIGNDCNNPKLKAIMDYFTPQTFNPTDTNEIALIVKSKPKTRVKSISARLRTKIKNYVKVMKD